MKGVAGRRCESASAPCGRHNGGGLPPCPTSPAPSSAATARCAATTVHRCMRRGRQRRRTLPAGRLPPVRELLRETTPGSRWAVGDVAPLARAAMLRVVTRYCSEAP